MKKIYLLFIIIFLFCLKGISQPVGAGKAKTPGAFNNGYLIPYTGLYDAQSHLLSLNLTGVLKMWSNLRITQVDDYSGTGISHISVPYKDSTGWDQWFFYFLNGGDALIDFTVYPYITVRAKTKWAGVKNVPMNITFKWVENTVQKSSGMNFTLKGDGQFHDIGIDYRQFPPLKPGFFDMAMYFNDSCTIDIDEFRFGSIGDPDTTIILSIDTLVPQFCEKDAGEQIIELKGINNGIDSAHLSLSQTNTKTTLFEGVPTFTKVNFDGTATMNYTPKAGMIGETNVHLVLTYNRGDSVKKYKSVWFNLSIIADPRLTLKSSNITAVVNQPKSIIKVSNATNSIGGASNLTLDATAGNTDLITNLVADPIKSDGTTSVTFIPGMDQCGIDTITLVITDIITNRISTYKISVEISDPSGLICQLPPPPQALVNSKKYELEVTPNPASDKINVIMPDENGGTLIISDITGRTLIQIAVPKGQIEVENINVSQLMPGIYFVSDASSLKVVRKLIIQ
jgi:hypothetical protein